jgi:parvulin-like peptidyl-prolyl isomerase
MSARKWTIRGLAGAALLACATGQTPAQAPTATAAAATAARPAAVVNGEPISMAEVETTMRSVGPTAVPMTQQQQAQLREDTLNALIEDVLWHQFLTKYAPKVTPEQITQELAQMEKELKEKRQKTLQDFYKDSGMTEAQMRVNVGYSLQWMAYCKAQVTDAMAKQYYDAKKDFFGKVQVRASHIMIRVDSKAPPADVATAKATLTALRQQLLEGKIDFAAAAKQYSQYPPTAAKGGDLGYFPRMMSLMDETIVETAFALKPGQISDVVQTDMGLHLIKCTERTPGEPSNFDKIKEDVRMFYVMELQQNIMNQMRKNAKIEKNI